jgi:hypothetical protein
MACSGMCWIGPGTQRAIYADNHENHNRYSLNSHRNSNWKPLEYEECCFLGCDAVLLEPAFLRNLIASIIRVERISELDNVSNI